MIKNEIPLTVLVQIYMQEGCSQEDGEYSVELVSILDGALSFDWGIPAVMECVDEWLSETLIAPEVTHKLMMQLGCDFCHNTFASDVKFEINDQSRSEWRE